jgi:hypothetical protein
MELGTCITPPEPISTAYFILPPAIQTLEPFKFLSTYLSVCPSVRPSVCPSVHPSVHPSIHPPTHAPIHPSVWLAVCLWLYSTLLNLCRFSVSWSFTGVDGTSGEKGNVFPVTPRLRQLKTSLPSWTRLDWPSGPKGHRPSLQPIFTWRDLQCKASPKYNHWNYFVLYNLKSRVRFY